MIDPSLSFNAPNNNNNNYHPTRKKEDIENRILNKFDFLKQENTLQQFYSSYDFREDEKIMVQTWKKILRFLFNEIFVSFALKMGDINQYSQIKKKIPVGLNNIIQQLRIEQNYLTLEDIKDEGFYKRNFPELSPPSQAGGIRGVVGNFFGGVKGIWNFASNTLGCSEEKDTNKPLEVRTDISDEEKYNLIGEDTLIFDYELFKNHCRIILMFLSDILHEKDEEIISVKDFENEIIIAQNKKEPNFRGYNLRFGSQNLEIVLHYLMKTKKIDLFDIKRKNDKYQFIKLLKMESDSVKEKDKALASLIIETQIIEKRIKIFQNKINNYKNGAKEQLKKKNKGQAKKILLFSKPYEKKLETLNNTLSILEKQIFDIRNMEDNASIANALKVVAQVGKEYEGFSEDFNDVTNELKNQKGLNDEIKNELKEIAGDNGSEEIDNELNQLMAQNDAEEMPNPFSDIRYNDYRQVKDSI